MTEPAGIEKGRSAVSDGKSVADSRSAFEGETRLRHLCAGVASTAGQSLTQSWRGRAATKNLASEASPQTDALVFVFSAPFFLPDSLVAIKSCRDLDLDDLAERKGQKKQNK